MCIRDRVTGELGCVLAVPDGFVHHHLAFGRRAAGPDRVVPQLVGALASSSVRSGTLVMAFPPGVPTTVRDVEHQILILGEQLVSFYP